MRAPSRLGPRPDASVLVRGSHPALEQQQQQVVPKQQQQQQLPQGWQSGVSSFAAAGASAAADAAADTSADESNSSSSVQGLQVQQQQPQQQEWEEVLLDFLSAFAVFEDFLNRPSFAAGRHILAATSRQPQLSLSYLQQPATSFHQQQQPQLGAAAAAAAALGRRRGSGHMLSAGSEGEAPGDKLSVSIGHLKLVLGPHSVSMGLQLATSLLDAATAARQADCSSAAASGRHSKAQPKVAGAAVISSSSAGSSGRPGSLTMRLQLSVCHAAINMERMVAADSVRGAKSSSSSIRVPRRGQLETLETKGLLSLLLLDVNSSVKQHSSTVDSAAAASVRSSPAAARPTGIAGSSSSGGLHAGGMQVSGSVAHVGVQDLCAPLEQRHVLSGAREPYQVRAGAFVAVRIVHNESSRWSFASLSFCMDKCKFVALIPA
jgi:hypothetical protein